MNNKLKNLYQKATEQDKSLFLSVSAKDKVKQKVFANLSKTYADTETAPSLWFRFRHSMFMNGYVLAPLMVMFFIISTTVVSADSVPGDVLYNFKRQVETARIFLASSDEAKLELELNFAEERIRELERIKSFVPVQDSKDSVQTKQSSDDNEIETEGNNKDKRLEKDIQRKQKENSQNSIKHIEREKKARAEAEHAIEFMEKTRKEYEEKERERAKELQEKIDDYRKKVLEQNKDREEEREHNEDADHEQEYEKEFERD